MCAQDGPVRSSRAPWAAQHEARRGSPASHRARKMLFCLMNSVALASKELNQAHVRPHVASTDKPANREQAKIAGVSPTGSNVEQSTQAVRLQRVPAHYDLCSRTYWQSRCSRMAAPGAPLGKPRKPNSENSTKASDVPLKGTWQPVSQKP